MPSDKGQFPFLQQQTKPSDADTSLDLVQSAAWSCPRRREQKAGPTGFVTASPAVYFGGCIVVKVSLNKQQRTVLLSSFFPWALYGGCIPLCTAVYAPLSFDSKTKKHLINKSMWFTGLSADRRA